MPLLEIPVKAAGDFGAETEEQLDWTHCHHCGTWYITDMGCPYCKGQPLPLAA